MTKQAIERSHTSDRMSRIVVHQDIVYLCGQVGNDYQGDIRQQTEEMLSKVDQLLEEAGSSRLHILSATVYLADMADFEGMNAVWDLWVPRGHAPARACVQATMAKPEIRVEISVVAAVC